MKPAADHMDEAAFGAMAATLTGDQMPRVWSLLVTVFGDIAQGPDDRVSGSLLNALTQMMGIKPEATRVALHRLRKDGWIASARSGRRSDYFLTDTGRAESALASPRIYGLNTEPGSAWLVLSDPGRPARADQPGDVWIASNMRITASRPVEPDAFVTMLGASDALPAWMLEKLCEDRIVQAMEQFWQQLNRLENALSGQAELSGLQITALRVLIVHGWRRIILKTPDLPGYVFPPDWRGADCRQVMIRLLEQLPKQQIATLEDLAQPTTIS